MIYIRIAHTEDEDWDYFSFSDILRAIAYLVTENITSWQMSDVTFEDFPVNDYTFMG